jgi:hypothetical protein
MMALINDYDDDDAYDEKEEEEEDYEEHASSLLRRDMVGWRKIEVFLVLTHHADNVHRQSKVNSP